MPEIYRRRLPLHPLLGRHVRHDPRSRAYPVAPTATALTAVRHSAFIDILDQGQLGSCTGNAGVGAIYRAPFYGAQGEGPFAYRGNEDGAVALYSAATKLDGYAGTYPPTDTGSDGLSVAKALKAAGIISGYLHAFDLQSALLQLMDTPLITGITWYESMFTPDADGVLTVDPESGVAGGHELCVDEYVPPSASGIVPAMVGGPNSWGTGWGKDGRWYMFVDDWQHLLADDGDVTAFVPATQPAPVPIPAPDVDVADQALWSATRHWSSLPHVGTNAAAAHAVKTWAKAKGLV
jgi:hypothetical protein